MFVKFDQYFVWMWILNFLDVFFRRNINKKFLVASLKTLVNSKDCFESRLNVLFWLSISVIGRISPVYMSDLASGTSFWITGSFRENF
jgi:hypothetical protein